MKKRNHSRRITPTSFLPPLIILGIVALSVNLSTDRFSVVANSTKQSQDKSAVQAQYANLPLAFEPNQGQADGGAQFMVHHGQATTYFDGASTTTSIGNDHVTMSLDGVNTPSFTGTDQLDSKTNYFIGNDKSKWHSDVPNYQQLLAKNVYPGIDLKYYGTNSQLEHDFIVNPGADPKQIAFHFDGQQDLSLDKDGNLILKAGESDLRLNAPTTYQETSNSKHTIPSHFELKDNTVTVALNEDYDHSQRLIIDPTLLYSTYLGGNGSETGRGVGVDPSGNKYICGNTSSTNMPTASPYQASNGGGTTDAFIAKLSANGSSLIYATYLGGNNTDECRRLAVDGNQNAYLTGVTASANFPTSVGAFQTSLKGTQDAYLTKLSTSGALIYSSYIGGTQNEQGNVIVLDSNGNIYIGGNTTSTNFPTLSAYQGSNGGATDGFITKFDSSGSTLLYSTYLGGSADEQLFGIAFDSSNNIYVTGQTLSTNFPTVSPYQVSNGGGQDAFVTKLNPTGSALIYSTYLGGTLTEQGSAIQVDSTNSAYVTGLTTSTNFPTASPYQASNGGGQDAFVTKLNPAGSSLVFSTYFGGSGTDSAPNAVLDSSNNLYFTGFTSSSSNFPIFNANQNTYGGGSFDGYVAKFNSSGSTLIFSTFIGGSGSDQSQRIALGLDSNIYIVGDTTSTDFPTLSPFQASNGGGGLSDFFLTELTEHTVTVTGVLDPTLSFSLGSTTCDFGRFDATQTKFCTHTITAATNAQNGYVISYIPTTTLTSGANTITAMAAQGASVVGTEQLGMNLKANTAAGSFTASNFGADPSGGSGVAMTGYQTANQFKFAVGGGNIAQSTIASFSTTYTASFITNITTVTEAGTYTTPITYNIVASY